MVSSSGRAMVHTSAVCAQRSANAHSSGGVSNAERGRPAIAGNRWAAASTRGRAADRATV